MEKWVKKLLSQIACVWKEMKIVKCFGSFLFSLFSILFSKFVSWEREKWTEQMKFLRLIFPFFSAVYLLYTHEGFSHSNSSHKISYSPSRHFSQLFHSLHTFSIEELKSERTKILNFMNNETYFFTQQSKESRKIRELRARHATSRIYRFCVCFIIKSI